MIHVDSHPLYHYLMFLTSSGHNSHAFANVMRALCDLSRKYPLDVSLDCAGGDQLLYVY